VAQPLDRNAELPELGDVDREGGEFWVDNPFKIPGSGNNLSAYERNRLFLNLDGEDFLDASFASGADIDSDSRAVIAADFDRDGASDLLVGSVGGGPLRLFLNRFPRTNRRIRLELTGVQSNRRGVGSRIEIEIGKRKIVRDLFPSNGGTGQGPVEWLIGVGRAARIDRLSVRWPTGHVQRFEDLPVDSTIEITEGQSKFVATEFPTPAASAKHTAPRAVSQTEPGEPETPSE
jgi:hypothetical protein